MRGAAAAELARALPRCALTYIDLEANRFSAAEEVELHSSLMGAKGVGVFVGEDADPRPPVAAVWTVNDGGDETDRAITVICKDTIRPTEEPTEHPTTDPTTQEPTEMPTEYPTFPTDQPVEEPSETPRGRWRKLGNTVLTFD